MSGQHEAMAQLPLALRYPPDQRLDAFVRAPEGVIEQLHALATQAPEGPRLSGADAVYLAGPSGVGKTHLLLASCAAAASARWVLPAPAGPLRYKPSPAPSASARSAASAPSGASTKVSRRWSAG